MEKRNIEYFKKLQEFIMQQKTQKEFTIMYKTYWDKEPTEQVLNNYNAQIRNTEEFEEDDDDSYDDSYDSSYDD